MSFWIKLNKQKPLCATVRSNGNNSSWERMLWGSPNYMGAGLPLPIPLPWRNAAMTEGKPISLFSSIPLKLTKLLKFVWLLWYVFCQTWTEMLLQIQEESQVDFDKNAHLILPHLTSSDFSLPPSKEECMTERKLIFLVPSKNPPLCVVLHNLCTNYKGGIFPPLPLFGMRAWQQWDWFSLAIANKSPYLYIFPFSGSEVCFERPLWL